MNNNYRFQLEPYKGRSSRHVCPQCGRKYVFTRYIDTHNNNIYINDNVGKCNRLDKCGYHYTPKQYFDDNRYVDDVVALLHDIGKSNKATATTKPIPPPQPKPLCTLPEAVATHSLTEESAHLRWLRTTFGYAEAERIRTLYGMGGISDRVIFWQRDIEGRLRTGKIMAYDATTGKRLRGEGAIDWVHALMRREGALPEAWELTQCLYGEHLLSAHPDSYVAVVEAPKTAHVGAILMPELVWVAVDSLAGLTAERLAPLRRRRVILFPDEGKGFEQWSAKIASIARSVGFEYRLSTFMEGKGNGADIADIVASGVIGNLG